MKTLYTRILTLALLLGVAMPGLAQQTAEQPDSRLPQVVAGGRYKLNGTTSQSVKAVRGALVGIFVASSTSCTIKLWDNTAGSGTVLVNTFGASAATWYPLPFVFNTGLFITVTGTCDYTVSYS